MIKILPTCRLLTVEVPEDAKGLSVWEATMSLRRYKKGDLFLGYIHKMESFNDPLPPGNWELLGRFEEITEETWKGIVEGYVYSGRSSYQAYKNYSGKNPESEDDILNTATASACSLIPGNPVVLIEKK